MKRFYGIIIALIGVAILAMGIVFITQANTAKKTVADQVAPIAVKDVNAQYDAFTAGYNQQMAMEQPDITAGKAAPSAVYDYYGAQRALLGLAKSNLGTAGFVLMSGVVDIVLGLGLILAGMALYMKPAA